MTQHIPIERCQVVNAAETVTSASELNNGEEEQGVDTETADNDAIKDDRPWGGGDTAWTGWPTQNFGWVGHNAFGPTNNWPVCSLVKLV